jgi:hypothetical protein
VSRDRESEEHRNDACNEEHVLFLSEVNTILLPIFVIDKHSNDVIIEYSSLIKDGDRLIEATWRVSAHPPYGLPTTFDWKVFRAVEELISEMPKPVENPINFSFYNLCKRMRVRPDKVICERIKESIKKFTLTGIESKRAFYLKEKRRRITTEAVFHLYDSCIFVNEEMPDGTIAETNYLWLNYFYLSNLNHNYVKPFDSEYYWSLRKPVSRRLYEVLSVKFYGMPDLHSALRQGYVYLCELIRITPQKYLSWAKKILEPAHEELIKTGFLKSAEWEKQGRRAGAWFILYVPGPKAIAEIEKARGEKLVIPIPELSQEQEEMVMALEARGVIYKIAKQLVLEFDQDKIRQVIDYIDWYKKQPNKVQNWGAYIAELIKDPEFSASPDFIKAIAEEKRKKHSNALLREAEGILEERIKEALKNWSDEKLIEEGVERAIRAREMLVKQGIKQAYTQEEIEEIRESIARNLPKNEEDRRRWLIMNGGDRFNLKSILEELKGKSKDAQA